MDSVDAINIDNPDKPLRTSPRPIPKGKRGPLNRRAHSFGGSPYGFVNPGKPLVEKLQPLAATFGTTEFLISITLMAFLAQNLQQYDQLFSTGSKEISALTIGGLLSLMLSSAMLLLSLFTGIKRVMWFHIITSSALCVYIFIVSLMMMYYGTVEPVADSEPDFISKHKYPGPSAYMDTVSGRDLGGFTLLGSVLHFVGTLTVFTYYSLKYVNPELFDDNNVEIK